jgi:hypothetical protein
MNESAIVPEQRGIAVIVYGVYVLYDCSHLGLLQWVT